MIQGEDKPNEPGWRGWDEMNRQQCLTCWKWQFPCIHSCPGAPQAGRTPPLDWTPYCPQCGHPSIFHGTAGCHVESSISKTECGCVQA